MDLTSLLADRLVMVTGKGGTGKTTYAAALAVAQAATGRRTCLCEVDSQRPSLGPVFGREPGFEPVNVRENLDVCNVIWPESLTAYLQSMIRVPGVVGAILGNDRVRAFLDFVPGSQELVTVSVIVDLLDHYDVVVVDLPASGHAFSLLDITRSALGLFRTGPIRTRVEQLREVLQAAESRVVFVALPEEMVVNETVETHARMAEADLLGDTPLVVLNRARKASMTEAERTLLARLSEAELDADADEFVAAGRWEASLEDAAVDATARLTEALGRPPLVVPPLGTGGNPREVVGLVATHLAPHLGLRPEAIRWP